MRHLKLFTFLLLPLFVMFVSCDNDNDPVSNNSSIESKITGEWAFSLNPEYMHPLPDDTSGTRDHVEDEFEEVMAIYEEVYLFEGNNGNILGYCGPHKFTGTYKDNELTLYVHELNDGVFGEDTTTFITAILNLSFDEFGHLKGKGTNINEEAYSHLPQETYGVYAHQVAKLSKTSSILPHGFSLSNILDKVCSYPEGKISKLFKLATDDNVRPMAASCWGKKNYRGYWLWGNIGPGAGVQDYPFWTQTVFVPVKFTTCHHSHYDFKVLLEDPITQIEGLLVKLKEARVVAQALGIDSVDDLIQMVEDFYIKYGQFAITYSWSDHTHQLSVMILLDNYQSEMTADVKNHELIQKIVNAIAGSSYVDAMSVTVGGRRINDPRSLKRGTCPTPMIYGYIIGTNNVKFWHY